jgi:hypothetical protein
MTCIADLARSCVPVMSSSQRYHFHRALVRKFFAIDSEFV